MKRLAAAALLFLPASVGGYHSAWVTDWDVFTSEGWECFDEINPFAFAFDARYEVYAAYPQLLERSLAARPEGVKIVPTIVNDVFTAGGKRIQTLKSVPVLTYWLADERRRQRHVEALLEAAAAFDGLEIDYEKVPDALWPDYIRFLAMLGQRLRAQGKTLAVDVEPGALYRKRGALAAAYWPQLAAACDKIKVMCYYERGDFSNSVGPGTSAEWVAETAKRIAEILPPHKVSLAFSLAGTDWEVPLPRIQLKRKVQRVHYKNVRKLLEREGSTPLWDDIWQAPFLRYEKDGRQHELWYEDERTLARKIDLARRAGLGGSLWYLGAARPRLGELGLCRSNVIKSTDGANPDPDSAADAGPRP